MKEVCKTCSGLGWVSNPNSPGEFNPPDCKGSGIVNETDGAEQDGEEAPSLTKIEEKAGQR